MSYSSSEGRAKRKRKPKYEKVPIKDAGIDHQILCLHAAMANKCLAEPILFEQVLARIETRHHANQMSYGSYFTWLAIIELKATPEEFKRALLEKSVKMRNMRRATVFTQVLTEQERVAVLDAITQARLKDTQ
jgi:hypothetical protein